MGAEFEREVIDALAHVGGAKNTAPFAVRLSNGMEVTTIPDLWGSNVGGLLEVKNVQKLSMSNQLRAQIQLATESGEPMNLIVSPRTRKISRRLIEEIELTGGKIYKYDPATNELNEFMKP